MSQDTTIEWTGATWNAVTGCTAVSPGCRNCYAARLTATRLKSTPKYQGLAILNDSGRGVFTGEVRCHEEALAQPFRMREPTRIFVNSMSDTFHEAVPEDFLDLMFVTMALCPQHTFQVLTKRPDRAAAYLGDRTRRLARWAYALGISIDRAGHRFTSYQEGAFIANEWAQGKRWPLPNVWIGTSVEDQARADTRIIELANVPAAVRFLSCEPLLGPVDVFAELRRLRDMDAEPKPGSGNKYLHWVIAGGESGPKAGATDLAWIRGIVRDCKAAKVPVFVKQLGAHPFYTRDDERVDMEPEDRKGGDMAEWPKDLRIREYPK